MWNIFQTEKSSQLPEHEVVEFHLWHVQVKRSARSRTLRLRVLSSTNLAVSSPLHVPLDQIRAFLHQHRHWIERTTARLSHTQQTALEDQEKIQLLGKWYSKKTLSDLNATAAHSATHPSKRVIFSVFLQGDQLILPEEKTPAQLRRAIDHFVRNVAEQYISRRLPVWAKTMGISYRELRFREQRSRWGSCSNNGTLSFNLRLGHFAPEVIDYVLIHELAHRKEMNHSSRFWRLVEQFDPLYKKHRLVLRRVSLSSSNSEEEY